MIGARIKLLREHFNLSKTAFGKKMDVTYRSVAKWENNEMQISKKSQRQIELTFNVNPEWLREGVGEMFLPSVPDGSTEEIEAVVKIMKDLPAEKQRAIKDEVKAKVSFYDYMETLIKGNDKKENDL